MEVSILVAFLRDMPPALSSGIADPCDPRAGDAVDTVAWFRGGVRSNTGPNQGTVDGRAARTVARGEELLAAAAFAGPGNTGEVVVAAITGGGVVTGTPGSGWSVGSRCWRDGTTGILLRGAEALAGEEDKATAGDGVLLSVGNGTDDVPGRPGEHVRPGESPASAGDAVPPAAGDGGVAFARDGVDEALGTWPAVVMGKGLVWLVLNRRCWWLGLRADGLEEPGSLWTLWPPGSSEYSRSASPVVTAYRPRFPSPETAFTPRLSHGAVWFTHLL
ncbi:unnamed protein product [Closterium sp. NIES-64]|nr:unnamed protein product [Closterium sp. NIES-64]